MPNKFYVCCVFIMSYCACVAIIIILYLLLLGGCSFSLGMLFNLWLWVGALQHVMLLVNILIRISIFLFTWIYPNIFESVVFQLVLLQHSEV